MTPATERLSMLLMTLVLKIQARYSRILVMRSHLCECDVGTAQWKLSRLNSLNTHETKLCPKPKRTQPWESIQCLRNHVWCIRQNNSKHCVHCSTSRSDKYSLEKVQSQKLHFLMRETIRWSLSESEFLSRLSANFIHVGDCWKTKVLNIAFQQFWAEIYETSVHCFWWNEVRMYTYLWELTNEIKIVYNG